MPAIEPTAAVEHHIVIHDPAGEYWEGSLLVPERAHQLAARGLVSLPVDPRLFKHSGIGGFMKRAWGAGWPLDHSVPRLVCPMTMFVHNAFHSVVWKARIVRDANYKVTEGEVEKFTGSLRLTHDSGQPHAQLGGMSGSSAVDLGIETQTEEMKGGGWIIGGNARLEIGGEGFLGLALYGMGRGLRVAWAAVALSP